MYRLCFCAALALCLVLRVHGQQQQSPQGAQQPRGGPQQGPQGGGGGGGGGQRGPQGGPQGGPQNGICPRPNTPPGPCQTLCQDDRACSPGFKCCDTGCGRACRRTVPPGPQGQGPNRGPNGQRGPNGNQGPQSQLAPQPSLVGLGGCSRGATLRNPDGSTLVCGFGPRDFACPATFSCVFDSVLRSLICCPSDEATAPPTPSPPNPCPDGEPLKDEFNQHLQCSSSGATGISNCPSGTLCTSGVCCRPQSVAGFLSIKPGQCPLPLPIAQTGSCTNECSFDAECQGALKCCFVGCGAKCVQVASEQPSSSPGTPVGAPPGTSGSGNAIAGGGIQPAPFELVPTRNDGIFLQQQRQGGFIPQQGGFLGDQQGGGFAARGPLGAGPQQGGRGGGPQPQFANRAQDFASKSESFLKGTLFRPGVAPVTANDTCENTACPTCHECSETTGIPRCIRMPDCCPDGTTPTACHTNPCPHSKCPDNPEAFCFPDGCSNSCRAVYYDRLGNIATCPTSANL